MQAFRDQIAEQQRMAGVRVIKVPHALGFLTPICRLLIYDKSIENYIPSRLLNGKAACRS